MEISKFLHLLNRRKLILVIVPVITVIITYLLVRNMPDQFNSRSRIATGMVDPSQQLIGGQDAQESKIAQQFGNIIQMMMLKKTLDQVSYQLILHDLTSDKPFREPSKQLSTLDKDGRQKAIADFQQHYKEQSELFQDNPTQKALYKLLKSMRYDDGSINDKLTIYREGSSDYISIEFQSENPELSAYVVNTITSEFISYYNNVVKGNQQKTLNFLQHLLGEKKAKMDSFMAALKSYKIGNHVLNLNEQAKALYGQISDFETRRGVAEQDIVAYTAAIKSVDDRFQPGDRKYMEESLSKINQSITETRDLLYKTNDAYVKNNFDPVYKKKMDSLRGILSTQISESADKNILSPLQSKHDLVTQKLQMEMQQALAKNSVTSIQAELNRLNQKFDALVPHEAEVQTFENNIDVSSREYLEILTKFNQVSLQSGTTVQLRQIEPAVPGTALPSKKMLLVILSGMISFLFCLFVLFILFYLDHSIQNPKELANATESPVLGYLPALQGSSIDLKQVWTTDQNDGPWQQYKDLLRSIRYEIDRERKNGKIVVLTSMKSGEGKTFFATSLAYAYAMANKKVILIDGNLSNPSVTSTSHTTAFLEDYLTSQRSNISFGDGRIAILGNHNHDRSPFELADEAAIQDSLHALTTQADIILIDTADLAKMNKSKEWQGFADAIVAVFEANQTLNENMKQHIAYLKRPGGKFAGWLMNKVSND